MIRRFQRFVPPFSRQVYLLLTASTLYGTSLIGINGVLGVLFQLRLGLSASAIGAVSATGSACYALSSLFSAKIAKRLGLQKTLILGAMTIALGMGLLPFAQFLGGPWPTLWMALINGSASLGWGLVTSLEPPAYSASARPRQRGRALGMNIGVRNIGRLIGVLMAGALPGIALLLPGIRANSAAAYSFGLWISFGIIALTLWPLLKLGPLESPTFSSNQQKTLPPTTRKPFILVGLLGFLGVMSQASVQIFGNAYLDSQLALSTPTISMINATAIAVAVIAAFSASSITERVGSKTSIVLSVTLMGLFALPIGLFRTPIAAVVSIVAETSIAALFFAASSEYQMRLIKPHERPRMSGIWCASAGAAFVLIAQGGGVLIDNAGYQQFFLLGALVGIPALLLAIVLPQAHTEEDPDETEELVASAS